MKQIIGLLLALLLLTFPCMMAAAEEEIETIVTIIPAPAQERAERPPCFPDPADNFIPLPETENFALGKPVSAGAHTDVYVSKNMNDGKTDTYWESKGFPAEVVIDLQGAYSVSTVAVCLNPSSIWEPRTQEIAVLVSQDGIDFETVQASFVKLVFTMNSSSRTGGAQAAEICVY